MTPQKGASAWDERNINSCVGALIRRRLRREELPTQEEFRPKPLVRGLC